jgi:hypothetical protein
MTGDWNASSAGTSGTYSAGIHQDATGNITGTASAGFSASQCGFDFIAHWSISGHYDPGSGFSILLSSPSPQHVNQCEMAETVTESGNLTNFFCGSGSGNFVSHYASGGTLSGATTWSRAFYVPSGEQTAFDSWADASGQPTNALFNATLNVNPNYNTTYVGDVVVESSPSAGHDGCFTSSSDPFPQLTTVTGGQWFVQQDLHYGPDLIGYGGTLVAWLQNYAPSRLPCTTTVPQRMAIYNDSTPGSFTPQPYGSTNTGNTNTLEISVTSTGVTSSRAGVEKSRYFHF